MTFAILTLTLSLAMADPDPTKPGMVSLDFRDRPAAEVAAEIGKQSGNAVHASFRDLGTATPVRKVTLVTPKPVPFWEAIDILCREARLQHYLVDGGFNGEQGKLELNESLGGNPSSVQYAGPFRLAKLSLQADFVRDFSTGREEVARLAEFQILAEPRILAIRNGPIRVEEALDGQGQPLVAPDDPDPEHRPTNVPSARTLLGRSEGTLRLKMGKPSAGATRLKVLRGVVPVRLAELPSEPSMTIPLSSPAGKVWSSGFVRVVIHEASPQRDGSTKLRFSVMVEGEKKPDKTPADADASAWSLAAQHLIDVVDAKGRPVAPSRGGMSFGDGLTVDYTFSNRDPTGAPTTPTHVRVFLPKWVDWNVPFEFRDLPLP